LFPLLTPFVGTRTCFPAVPFSLPPEIHALFKKVPKRGHLCPRRPERLNWSRVLLFPHILDTNKTKSVLHRLLRPPVSDPTSPGPPKTIPRFLRSSSPSLLFSSCVLDRLILLGSLGGVVILSLSSCSLFKTLPPFLRMFDVRSGRVVRSSRSCSSGHSFTRGPSRFISLYSHTVPFFFGSPLIGTSLPIANV